MTGTVKSHAKFLKFLQAASSKQGKAVLITGSAGQINILTEIVKNLIEGNIFISPSDKTSLRKYRLILHKIANPKVSIKNRRVLLIKISRILPVILRGIIKRLDNHGARTSFNSES